MEIPGSTSGIPQTVTTRPAGTPSAWQIGQQLHATVLENSTGKLLLAIGNRQVSAETSLSFERGQMLTLEVRNLGQQPVLKLISALQESPTAMAMRLLLPRHGASTPLLASLAELVRTPNAPVPVLVREAARNLVTNLPTVSTLTTAEGLKQAVQNSGLFLESRLLQGTGGHPAPVTIQSDYKANLVRLIQLVRNWPGSSIQTPATPRGTVTPAGTTPAAPTPVTPPQTGPLTGTPITHPQPVQLQATQAPLLRQPPPTVPSGSNQAAPNQIPSSALNTGTDRPAAPPAAPETAAARTDNPAAAKATPDQVQRAIQGNPPSPASAPRAGLPTAIPPAAATLSANPTAASSQGASGLSPPPPFPGTVPVAQTPVEASLDLIKRLGNLRLDLLQHTEAALARVQLAQLTALPREGERGLVEWMFDLPVRRGEATDVWSARFYRDDDERGRGERPEAVANWTVQLAFDLPGLGPMQAQIQLRGERVSTHFWTTEPDTLPLVRDNLHELRQALLNAGLEVDEVDCRTGAIADSPGNSGPSLISEKV